MPTDPDPDPDPDADAPRLSHQAYAAGDPTGWFDRLYLAAEQGAATVPWDHPAPAAGTAQWLADRPGAGRSAVVVGCGFGRDAEYLAARGYAVTAFDLSPAAVRAARERHPDSPVRYEVADLLALPHRYLGAFDLVLESYTVQSLPEPLRGQAITAVPGLVAPGGTLLVVAAARRRDEDAVGPPWPLTREEIDAFAASGLDAVAVESLTDDAGTRRWRAEFYRPSAG